MYKPLQSRLTQLRRTIRENRVRLGKRVKNVPEKLSNDRTEQLFQSTGRYFTLHPTKGWRSRSFAA